MDFCPCRLCKQCNCEERKAKYREAKGETAYTIRRALKQQGLKKCTECEEILPLTDFDLQNKNSDVFIIVYDEPLIQFINTSLKIVYFTNILFIFIICK